MVLPLAVMLCLTVMPFLANPVQAANPPAFFSLSVLAPNTNPARNQWSTLMVEQLPKIGIGVDVFDHTGWSQISPRSWGHPVPPPTYDEGGFDILFIGWGWGLDIDFVGLFDTPSIPPDGDNHYSYSVPEMDWALSNYSQAFVLADRIQYAHDIQDLLYEDIPAATIVYPTDIFPHSTALVEGSWDPLLWDSSYEDMAYWDLGKSDLHYGCPADFEDFHTMKTESVYDAQWTQQIYGGIAERNPAAPYNNAFAPYGCTSFTSADGLVYQVQLDPNCKFADGTTMNASDIEFSFDLLINTDFGHPDYGFNQLYYGPSTITINSEFDITVTFLQNYVFQDNNLGVDILPKHIWDPIPHAAMEAQAVTWAADETLDSNLMGIGPYYLEDWDGTNGVIHLKANPYWDTWGGHATQLIDDIYFEFYSNKEGALSALAGGALDIIDTNFQPVPSEIPGSVDYVLVPAPGSQEMGFNMNHPYLGTGELCPIASEDSGKYIRTAISHLIPRDTIVEEILEGLGLPGVTPWVPVAVGYKDTLLPLEYSIDLAKSQMELAGFEYPETVVTGIGLYVVIGILALAGASQVFFLKRRK
ncbi:MAG: hypothetical protein FK732_08395 [Asgard group archaeon]|nr:hypothetical protein [Asgard group archaeon]